MLHQPHAKANVVPKFFGVLWSAHRVHVRSGVRPGVRSAVRCDDRDVCFRAHLWSQQLLPFDDYGVGEWVVSLQEE